MASPSKKASAANETPAATDGKIISVILNNMSRVLTHLSDLESLKSTKLGLAEWLTLREIGQLNGKARPGQLAKRMGVSPQRMNTIMKSLDSQRYVQIERSKEDSRGREIRITDSGRGSSEAVERELLLAFADVQNAKPLLLTRLRANLKGIVDQWTPPIRSDDSLQTTS